MYHRLWILANILFVLATSVYIWFIRPHESALIMTGQLFAQVALLLFAINVNMHFIFMAIKKASARHVKITLAKLSRKVMKAHIPFAIIGTAFILLHAGIMISSFRDILTVLHPKMISGFFSLLILTLTLFGGYLRHRRASGFRRKFHLTMAFFFTAAFLFHLFLPL